MSDNVIIAIFTSLPPTIVAAAALWQAIKAKAKIADVHKELNSRLTEWRSETAKATIASNAAAKAEGLKEGQETKETL